MDKRIAILLPLLAVLLLAAAAKADIAPPFMRINVTYNNGPVNGTFYATVLTCTNSSTSGGSGPVPQLNISQYDSANMCYWTNSNYMGSASCADSNCMLEYYSRTKFRVAFYLPGPNKVFTTGDINESSYASSYSAQLYPNGTATISNVGNNNNSSTGWYAIGVFALALATTIIIELAVAFLYLKAVKIKNKRRILLTAILANVISLPLLWFVFVIVLGGGLGLAVGEVFAVVFEGWLIHRLSRKAIKLKSALLMSLIMNIASAVIGSIILLLLLA